MKVIINADDLGKEPIVNKAIEEQICLGTITSTTIMANADGFEGAVAITKKYSQISYGIHLILDEYRPILDCNVFRETGIVDANGNFVVNAIFKAEITNELLDAVENEWDAQLCKLEQNGIYPTHIDSHHHVHTIPALQPILIRLMRKHNILKVRNCDYINKERALHGYKHFYGNNRLKEIAYLIVRMPRFIRSCRWTNTMRETAKMADIFCSTKSYFNNKEYFTKYATDKVVELECHPGHPLYISETAMLTKIDGVEKITYKEL